MSSLARAPRTTTTALSLKSHMARPPIFLSTPTSPTTKQQTKSSSSTGATGQTYAINQYQ